jgi:hypothetical protein
VSLQPTTPTIIMIAIKIKKDTKEEEWVSGARLHTL